MSDFYVLGSIGAPTTTLFCLGFPLLEGQGGLEPLQLGDLRDAALLEVLDDGLGRVLLGDRVSREEEIMG